MTPLAAASGRCHFVLRFYVCCNQRCLGASVLAVRHVYMVKKRCNVLPTPTSAWSGSAGSAPRAAEALARTGIGAITLIDMDDVCVTNTNRQIHALSGNVGLAKAEVMAERIRLINPECRVTVVDDFVTPENVAEYLGVGFSYVIDAIDSVRPKAALIAPVSPLQGAAGYYRRGGWSD